MSLASRPWLLASCGMVKLLSDWSYNNTFTLNLSHMSEPDKKRVPEEILKKFKEDNRRFASDTTSVLSYVRRFYDFEDYFRDDEPGLATAHVMAYCDQVDANNAWFVWRGTLPMLPHEWFFSLGGLSDFVDGGRVETAASIFGEGTPGFVRRASGLAFVADDPIMGSLFFQTDAALDKLISGSTLHVFGHSMGAGMALYTALVAIKKNKFKKIKVYIAGGVKSVSQTTADYMKANGVEVVGYELEGDVVPHLDNTLNHLKRLTCPSETFGPVGYTRVTQQTTENLKKLVTPGTLHKAYMRPGSEGLITSHVNETYMSAFLNDKSFRAFVPVEKFRSLTSMSSIDCWVEQQSREILTEGWKQIVDTMPKYSSKT
ncbi:hypothetical protein F5884DRAFT_856215 [Xylogone sp. PMI_703]|nr:hypothetical protein F5884DRAFT_856215 [Xylogone sp. PMI_703]